tara:strand:- start:1931 stop:3466 length:1536 start_codon:yes stop_codon:yes gene_type:complete
VKKKIEKTWEGSTEQFATLVKSYALDNNIITKDQEPNIRLLRDYVSRGIISKPRKEGKEVFFGYSQIIEFLACRVLINDGWPLKKIADDFQKSTLEEIKLLVPSENQENDSMKLIKSFGRKTKESQAYSLESSKPKSMRNLGAFRAKQKSGLDFIKSKEFLKEDYRPSEDEPFMNENQVEYFRSKLLDWKKSILSESKDTIKGMKEETRNSPDVADRASEETDRALELRTRDRQRKLISKIDSALRRIDDGSYGYCDETGEPISLKRLDARPIATLSIEAQQRHERRERPHRRRPELSAGEYSRGSSINESLRGEILLEGIDPNTFFQICEWAKENKKLASWQISVAFSAGKLLARKKAVSAKLAIQAKKILDEAMNMGFSHSSKNVVRATLRDKVGDASIEPSSEVQESRLSRFVDVVKETRGKISERFKGLSDQEKELSELERLAKSLGVANASFSTDNFTRLNITKNINVQIESSELKDMTRERAKAVARAIELNLIIKKNREENNND